VEQLSAFTSGTVYSVCTEFWIKSVYWEWCKWKCFITKCKYILYQWYLFFCMVSSALMVF